MSEKTMLRLNPECVKCMLKRYLNNIPEEFDELHRLEYMQVVCQKIADASKENGAPVVIQAIKKELQMKFGITEDFSKEKHYFNQRMLALENQIMSVVQRSDDLLKAAIQYAMTGNYIDYGSMHNVDEEYLEKALENSMHQTIAEETLDTLKNELNTAKRLVLLTDNCGEIVLDKILLQTIKTLYPQIEITTMVRGGDTLNDATMKDAIEVGLDKVAKVVDNGTEIAGTCLKMISQEALAVLDSADIILSKGQANFETLRGCGKNIYYIFLCKCVMFAERFEVDRFTGMLIKDKDYIEALDRSNKENADN